MSVIIRLQNLPWSANALDIRQFFKGLSIPEGGVHIVGGEMGDAFIAFSTDEDARQAMMNDRKSIKEVQVRLLLSSRAEMQKVIETARLTSLSLLQQMAARTAVPIVKPTAAIPTPTPTIYPVLNQATTPTATLLGPTPSFLAYQQQAGITLAGSPIPNDFETKTLSKNDDSTSTRRSGDRNREHDRRRSTSRDRRDYRRRRDDSRSRSRERERERTRNRDRERESSGRRYDRSRRSPSRESRERSTDRSRSRNYNRNNHRSESKERDPRLNRDTTNSRTSSYSNTMETDKPKSNWGMSSSNIYQTNPYQTNTLTNAYSTNLSNKENAAIATTTAPTTTTTVATVTKTESPEVIIPAFQNYTSTSISNNYSINLYGLNSNSNSSDAVQMKPFVLQNPYTTAQQQTKPQQPQTTNPTNETKLSNVPIIPKALTTSTNAGSDNTNQFSNVEQEPIAFAKTNPYEQMYPSLFAQAAAQQMPRSNATAAQRMNSPNSRNNDTNAYPDSSSIKISNMCTNTNYSDLRKFFSGLFIPHNGIKMVNDQHGSRTGVAFIQFSRASSIPKALMRDNTMLKSNIIHIEVVPDEEFNETEDAFRPGRFERSNYNDGDTERHRYDGGGGGGGYQMGGNDGRGQSRKNYEEPIGPFCVLYVEELPPLTTEQDLMKMFSSYTLYDILLLPSAENRREYVAYVKFSLAEDAKAALDDKSTHMIGYRKVRVYAGKEEDMEKAKEKLRLANEQLRKEEEEEANRIAAAEAEALAAAERDLNTTECPMVIEDGSEADAEEFKNSKLNDLQNTNRDPRMIPSLLAMPAAKPPSDDEEKIGNNRNILPADPRLRTRTRPSRFDANDPSKEPTMNTAKNNNSTNNVNNIMDPTTLAFRNSTNQFMQQMLNNGGNGLNNNNSSNMGNISNNNNNNQFNDMQMPNSMQMPMTPIMPFQRNTSMDNNFILIFNCPYSTRQNDIGELFCSANLLVKHIEMLTNERNMPSGEFILEMLNPHDAETSFNEFNNTQFRGRSMRVRKITPQEIADRLKKPFMNCVPGGSMDSYNFNNNNNMMMNMSGGGMRNNGGGMGMQFNGPNNNNNNNNMRNSGNNGRNNSPIRRGRRGGGAHQRGGGGSFGRNNNFSDSDDKIEDDNKDNDNYSENDNNQDTRITNNDNDVNNGNEVVSGGGGGGIPEKFTRPNCVVSMENVPYKADLDDILRFFSSYKLRPDDIIRRYNDDGSATGDARVAFLTPGDAKDAFIKCNRKQIFNRTIYLNII